MITISIGILLGIVFYALIVTGLMLAVLCGASRDVQDLTANNTSLRESLFEQAKTAVKQSGELVEMQNQKLELLRKYVDVQNEYAWYRMLNRDKDMVKAAPSSGKLTRGNNEKVG